MYGNRSLLYTHDIYRLVSSYLILRPLGGNVPVILQHQHHYSWSLYVPQVRVLAQCRGQQWGHVQLWAAIVAHSDGQPTIATLPTFLHLIYHKILLQRHYLHN